MKICRVFTKKDARWMVTTGIIVLIVCYIVTANDIRITHLEDFPGQTRIYLKESGIKYDSAVRDTYWVRNIVRAETNNSETEKGLYRSVNANGSTRINLTSGKVMVSYSSAEPGLTIVHKSEDKKYQVQLQSEERMGVFIEVDGSEFTYSLRFLEEDEDWPTEELSQKKTYSDKSVTKLPGWVVVIIAEVINSEE